MGRWASCGKDVELLAGEDQPEVSVEPPAVPVEREKELPEAGAANLGNGWDSEIYR